MILFELFRSFITDGVLSDANNNAISEVLNLVISFITQPVTYSFGRAFTVYFQGVALLIASVVIVVKGITTGILINGGTEDQSVGNYIYQSLKPIILIALTPSIMSLVTTLVHYLINDLMVPLTGIDFGTLLLSILSLNSNPITSLIGGICAIAVIYYTITVILQCIKRQFQLAIFAIVGPLLAAITASENNAGDFVSLLKEMGGIGLITVLQLACLMAAITLPATPFFTDLTGVLQPFFVVASFAAIKQIPKWIERYTLVPTVAGQGSAMRTISIAAASFGRSAISKAVR